MLQVPINFTTHDKYSNEIFECLIKSFPTPIVFTIFFPPANVEHLFINLLFQPIPFQFLSSHKKCFFPPPSIFDFSFSAEVHEYYFTLHCVCISFDQEIKMRVRGMRLDPAGLLTTETRVTIPLFPPAVAQQTRAGGGST